MSTLISFDESGKIVGCGVGPSSILEAAAESSEFAIIYDGSDASEETHYVEDGALVEKPSRPSEEHVFNYASRQWVYDLTQHKDEACVAISAEKASDKNYTQNCDQYHPLLRAALI